MGSSANTEITVGSSLHLRTSQKAGTQRCRELLRSVPHF